MGTEHPTLLVQLESGIRIIRDIRNAGTLPLTDGAVVIERIDQPAKRSGLFALVAPLLDQCANPRGLHERDLPRRIVQQFFKPTVRDLGNIR